jgi:hypothetical protein
MAQRSVSDNVALTNSSRNRSMAGPTTHPFLKAFACAAAVYAIVVIVALLTLGTPARPEYGARLLGELFSFVVIPALITGFIAWRSKRAWSTWRIVGIYALAQLVVFVLWLVNAIGNLPK